jgi:hypothetical protein
MITANDRFRDRVAEVDHYFSMLVATEDALLQRGMSWRDGRKKLPKILSSDLSLKLLKSTSFLVLYNLIEATVRDGVESIWLAVGNSNAKVFELLPELRDVWVQSEFRKKDAFSASGNTYRALSIAILNYVVEERVPSVAFKRVGNGGNLDQQAIQELCRSHGVSFSPPRGTRAGVDIGTIKSRRNILAHGEQTFAEIGSSYTTSDLIEIKNRSKAYLRQFARRVDRYIQSSSFKVA